MNVLLEPFSYEYMLNAMWVSAMVGGLCAFLSCYLMLKGWSLIGDALSHSIVPGVAGAYMLGLPFSLGAFFSGGLAAGSMLFLNQLRPSSWAIFWQSIRRISCNSLSLAFSRSSCFFSNGKILW